MIVIYRIVVIDIETYRVNFMYICISEPFVYPIRKLTIAKMNCYDHLIYR
jgi:hypothetical protein